VIAEDEIELRMLWAKTAQNGEELYHPLLHHMLDVAAVTGMIWDQTLTARLRQRIERALGVSDARLLVMFMAGAHDVGKASPGFQKKVLKLSDHLTLRFSQNDKSCPHGFISSRAVKELGHCQATDLLGQIIGGHHGVFPRSQDLLMGKDTLGNREWEKARHGVLSEFTDTLGFDLKQVLSSLKQITDPFIVPVISGFVSVADWIGSNQDFFKCATEYGRAPDISIFEYWKVAQTQAQRALEALGWLPSPTFAHEVLFEQIFPFESNYLQKAVIKLVSGRIAPYLMIVEAPMGHGKTEAAFYAADLAMCRNFARGLYIAMPTQATSNAMFRRVLDDYLTCRGHTGKLNLQLVHGNALLAQMLGVEEGEINSYEPRSIEEEDGDLEAQSWFTARKRPLLAPFGVGTIDQCLLSVIQTKHWFVRLFGLTEKVVVFDEVHAYDVYMGTILERLLQWLAELDCTVILLSATLPESKKKSLVKAYSGGYDAAHNQYPCITVASPRRCPDDDIGKSPICVKILSGESSKINLHFAHTNLPTMTESLQKKLVHGGCAAVICNTVDRSIEIFSHLRDNLKNTECLLFHARTLQKWRREREEEVLQKFGKYVANKRPHRAVLVATQVIEQSLDLDFDIMISELAPVDLLLQRLGRLHRHTRKRPSDLELPQFIVLCDADPEGPAPESFGTSIEHVYDRYILLRTWLAIRQCSIIRIPIDVETLVEAVYGSNDEALPQGWVDALSKAKNKMKFERDESEKSAKRLLVAEPQDPVDLIEQFNMKLYDDEAPEVHKTVRAATREGDPSITVVIAPQKLVLSLSPDIPEVQKLLDCSSRISHQGVFRAMLEQGESPPEWSRNTHLRHAKLLRLNVQNQGRVGDYILTVDEKLGIMIDKNKENEV
jgi:CRISPR-associated endonuclease/helicase Cas3